MGIMMILNRKICMGAGGDSSFGGRGFMDFNGTRLERFGNSQSH